LSGSTETIYFTEALPDTVSPNAILRNTRYNTTNVLIEGCTFSNTNGHGIILSASAATVNNCSFENVFCTAIELEVNIVQNLWSEGNGASNVLVQNNRFVDVSQLGEFGGAVIYTRPTLPWGPTNETLFDTLTLINNTFENCPGPAISLSNCSQVIADSNQMNYTRLMAHATRYSGAILASYSSNLALGGNTWINQIPSTFACGVVTNMNSTSGVTSDTNALLDYTVTGVTAVSGTANVGLSWVASPGVVNYYVKRATVSEGPYTIIASPTTNNYSDSSCMDGTMYYYVISAITASGETENSAEISVVFNPTPIQQWRQAYFGTMAADSLLASDTANPAGDGIPNLLKYATGRDPTTPINGSLLTTGSAGGFLTLTFNRARIATDITYHIEATNDLLTWIELWNSSDVPYAGGTNAVLAVTVSDVLPMSEASNPRRFLRLKITHP